MKTLLRPLFLFVVLIGCTGTRIGNPHTPEMMPEDFTEVEIDPDRMWAESTADGVVINGEPGAGPPGSEVRAAQLEDASDWQSASVNADGSFVLLTGSSATWYVVQAFVGAEVSRAVQVTTGFFPMNFECIRTPGLQIANDVEAGAELSFQLVNDCPERQTATLMVHPLSQGLALVGESTIDVAASETVEARVLVTAASHQTFDGTIIIRTSEQTVLATIAGTVL